MEVRSIERKEITDLIANMDLEGLSKIQVFLNDMDKKVIINKANDLKTISYILSYLHVFNVDERKLLIKKVQNDLYSLMCECFDILSKDEVSYIVLLLCNNMKIEMIFDVVNNFKCSLSNDDIDNIVTCVTTIEKDPWEIVNLLKMLQFKLSESNITDIINSLCNIKCIKALISLLDSFNKVLSHDQVINIITTIFNNDKKGLYLQELIKNIDYSILNEDDMKYIIQQICKLENEDNIPCLIYNIAPKLNSKLVNYTVTELYINKKITVSVSSTLLNNFLDLINDKKLSLIIKSICDSKNGSYLNTISNKLKDIMSDYDVDNIVITMYLIKSPYYIIEVSKALSSRLTKNQIEFLGETLCEINNIKFIYEFSLMFNDKISDELRSEITNKMLNSGEIKYIILYAIFVSGNELITMLFDNVNSMYIYIMSNGLFKEEEIKLINEKLNIKPTEPDIYKTLNLINDNDMKI